MPCSVADIVAHFADFQVDFACHCVSAVYLVLMTSFEVKEALLYHISKVATNLHTACASKSVPYILDELSV